MSASKIAALVSVTKTTAYRWMKAGDIPQPYRELLEIKAFGLASIADWPSAKSAQAITDNDCQPRPKRDDLMISGIMLILRENERLKRENAQLCGKLQQIYSDQDE